MKIIAEGDKDKQGPIEYQKQEGEQLRRELGVSECRGQIHSDRPYAANED